MCPRSYGFSAVFWTHPRCSNLSTSIFPQSPGPNIPPSPRSFSHSVPLGKPRLGNHWRIWRFSSFWPLWRLANPLCPEWRPDPGEWSFRWASRRTALKQKRRRFWQVHQVLQVVSGLVFWKHTHTHTYIYICIWNIYIYIFLCELFEAFCWWLPFSKGHGLKILGGFFFYIFLFRLGKGPWMAHVYAPNCCIKALVLDK